MHEHGLLHPSATSAHSQSSTSVLPLHQQDHQPVHMQRRAHHPCASPSACEVVGGTAVRAVCRPISFVPHQHEVSIWPLHKPATAVKAGSNTCDSAVHSQKPVAFDGGQTVATWDATATAAAAGNAASGRWLLRVQRCCHAALRPRQAGAAITVNQHRSAARVHIPTARGQ